MHETGFISGLPRPAAAFAWAVMVLALTLPGCLNNSETSFTESPLTYAAPSVSGVTMTATGGTAVTFTWTTGKAARGFLQIAPKEKFEADRVSSGKKALILASKYGQGEYPGHSLDFTPILSSTVRRDDRDVYNTQAATSGNTREAYYTFEAISDPLPVGLSGQAPTTVLDVSYIHAVNMRIGSPGVLSEYLFKCSLSNTTLEKARLTAGQLKIFKSLTTWTLGLTTYSSPYITDPSKFDISFLLDAGAKYNTELYFASFASSDGAITDNHSVTVKGLTRGSKYSFRVVSADPWGQATIGPLGSFVATDILTITASADLGDRVKASLPSGAWFEVPTSSLQGISGVTLSVLAHTPEPPEGMKVFGSMHRAGPPGGFGTATIAMPLLDAPAGAAIYKWDPVKGYEKIGGTISGAGTDALITTVMESGGHFVVAAE